MIREMDEALRQLLIRELPIENNEVDIAFEQPKRDWSTRISRPTLNLFLYDVREHLKMRAAHQGRVERMPNGTAVQRRPPVKIQLAYMITAWAINFDDEHNLLSRALLAFFRQPFMPEDLLPEELQDQPSHIELEVSREDTAHKPVDVWTVLDNDLRPSVTLMVTLSADPYRPVITPLVRTRELRVGQSARPATHTLLANSPADAFWTIGGTLRSDSPIDSPTATLLEQGRDIQIQPDGQFSINRLKAGSYTLEVRAKNKNSKRHTLTVPAPDYDLEV